MQLSTCVKWRHVRHEITLKNDQRIIFVHVRDSHVSAFQIGPNFYCQKLRCPWWHCKVLDAFKENRGSDGAVDCTADIGKVKKNWVSAEWQGTFRRVSLLGGAINSINNALRGDFNATPDEIKFHMVCVRSFLGQTSLPRSFINMSLMSLIFTYMILRLIAFLMMVR